MKIPPSFSIVDHSELSILGMPDGFEAESKNLGTYHDKMQLCSYSEWACKKALGLTKGEWVPVPVITIGFEP